MLKNGVLEKEDCTFLNINTENIISFQEWFIIKSEDGDISNADLDYVLKEGDKVIIRDINSAENRMEITFEKEDGTRVIAVY